MRIPREQMDRILSVRVRFQALRSTGMTSGGAMQAIAKQLGVQPIDVALDLQTYNVALSKNKNL